MSGVRTSGLRKEYRAKAGQLPALDGVDLDVPAGSVYGLVGPNGAGKTTLLSLLAGLRRPTSGSIQIGTDRRRVAVLPDTPHFEPWLTGREVVDLARALVAPEMPVGAVDDVLAQAGLSADAGRRTGGYSRGMLQRLGLAATLVGRPELLLLDEPASALDPGGRREVLDLIGRLRGQATVILSSHILSDVQEVADHIGILRAGRLLFQGPLTSLLQGRTSPIYDLRLRPPVERVATALRAASWITEVEEIGPDVLRLHVSSLAEAEQGLAGVLAASGARVVSLRPESPDLEDVFLALTA